MDPLKIYAYLTAAHARLFGWVRPLSVEQYTGEHPIGLGSLSRTLNHIMTSESYYMLRLRRAPVPPLAELIAAEENPPPFAELERVWGEQARDTASALAVVSDWLTEIEYSVTRDGRPLIVSASPADIFMQLSLHEVHHRAQAMNILRQLGVTVDDIDYNTMSYKIREA